MRDICAAFASKIFLIPFTYFWVGLMGPDFCKIMAKNANMGAENIDTHIPSSLIGSR